MLRCTIIQGSQPSRRSGADRMAEPDLRKRIIAPGLALAECQFISNLDDDAGKGPEIVPILNFVPDSYVGIRPGSPAPISIAVAHLPLRASGSDE